MRYWGWQDWLWAAVVAVGIGINVLLVYLIVTDSGDNHGYVLTGRVVAQTDHSVTFFYCEQHAKISDKPVNVTYSWGTPAPDGQVEMRRTYRRVGNYC